jgi:hypothetical protein
MTAEPASNNRVTEPTLASTWHAAVMRRDHDELLDWPPDLFALTNVILARSEAFRFALSPIQEWPPEGYPDWARMVVEGGLRWAAWAEHRRGPPPELVSQEWAARQGAGDMPLEHLAQGSTGACAWRCSRSRDGRRGVRRARRRTGHFRRRGLRLSRPWPGDAGQDGVDGTRRPAPA